MKLEEKFDYYVKTLTSIPLPPHCISISDLHAAAGNDKDPLAVSGNEALVIELLNHYYAEGYTLLKNGDWWDVWRGRSLDKIFGAHKDLVAIVEKYREDGCLYETLGNHERNICAFPEAYIFHSHKGRKLFMWHGYFGDWPNDAGWMIGRVVVRAAEDLGIDPLTSPHPSNPDRHEAVKKTVKEFTDSQQETWDFLWGHTHFFSNGGNSYNSGSPTIANADFGFVIESGVFSPLACTK
jgi:hypothetical protein